MFKLYLQIPSINHFICSVQCTHIWRKLPYGILFDLGGGRNGAKGPYYGYHHVKGPRGPPGKPGSPGIGKDGYPGEQR